MGKAKKGGKKTKDDDAKEIDEKTLLLQHAKDMKKKLVAEQQQFNEFQQQREKLNYFWIVEKKNLEDRKAQARNKKRELQDQEEKHQVEIKVYKQRMKHLLYEHQNEVTHTKTDCNKSLKLSEDENRTSESFLKQDQRSLKVQVKETELTHDDFITSLKQDQDLRISELRQIFELKTKDLQNKHEKKSRILREQLEAQRKTDIQRIERRKDSHTEELMKSHEKSFAEIKNYYNDITHNNLDLIKTLKEEVAEMKKKESADEKLMHEIAQENKRMSEPLRQALQDVERFRTQLEDYKRVKVQLKKNKGELGVLEDEVAALKWEQEILDQRFEILEEEKNDLYDKFQSTVFEVQQKTGFKNLLLEKKAGLLDKELEKTDGYLNEILHQFNLDPSTKGKVQKKLDDIIEEKNRSVETLSRQIAEATKQHNYMVQNMTEKLAEYGIPVAELGFEPKLVTNPAVK